MTEAKVAEVIKGSSKLTSKGQLTVPKTIRQALALEEGDSVTFSIINGLVTMERSDTQHEDPALGHFLALLAADIANKPERLQPLPPLKPRRDVDLDAPIEGDVDL
jgi:antitoxin PrlF